MAQSDNQYFVYALQCSDNFYYIGSDEDLNCRRSRYNSGRAESWTAKRRSDFFRINISEACFVESGSTTATSGVRNTLFFAIEHTPVAVIRVSE